MRAAGQFHEAVAFGFRQRAKTNGEGEYESPRVRPFGIAAQISAHAPTYWDRNDSPGNCAAG